MTWTRWTAGLTAATSLAIALVAFSCTTAQAPPRRTEAEKLARGRTLSWTSGCNDCHTPGTFYGAPDTTRLLSGSELGWQGPWGVTYARNLTPDPETGIGSWSEDDIVRAFRTGRRPDQTPLLPPMPWPSYAQMSDDDAYALAAFIKSVPPLKHKNLDRVPPGATASGAILAFPLPPAWDAQNLPPPPAAASKP